MPHAVRAIGNLPTVETRNAAIVNLFNLFVGQQPLWAATVLPHCCAIIEHLPTLLDKSDAISRIHEIAANFSPIAYVEVMTAIDDALPR